MSVPTLLLLVAAGVACTLGGADAKTTFTYTRDASKLVNVWVDHAAFEVLGGKKAPKFTGSAVSAGIIRWDPNDDHHMHARPEQESPVSAVLSTGDAKLAISKVPYKGGDKKPSYPDIVNSNIKGSHDAVVLDFWVRAKVSEGVFGAILFAASNEGSPEAVKLHGNGKKDMFHFEVDGKIYDSNSFERIWANSATCDDHCQPHQDGQKMHYYADGVYYDEFDTPAVVEGKEYHIKLRLADTGTRLVDSALYLNQGKLVAWNA